MYCAPSNLCGVHDIAVYNRRMITPPSPPHYRLNHDLPSQSPFLTDSNGALSKDLKRENHRISILKIKPNPSFQHESFENQIEFKKRTKTESDDKTRAFDADCLIDPQKLTNSSDLGMPENRIPLS